MFFILREEFQTRGNSGLRFVFPPQLVFDLLEDFLFVDTIATRLLHIKSLLLRDLSEILVQMLTDYACFIIR